MDESFHEFEAELKSLRLRRPSAGLKEHIARALAAGDTAGPVRRYSSATNLGGWKWHGWQLAGLAAVVALIAAAGWRNLSRRDTATPAPAPASSNAFAVAPVPAPVPSASPARLPGVAATNVLYDMKDEGPVYLDGDRAARRVRYRFLDTYTLRNPRTNASLKWSVPRDEIRVLPASLN
ncbi:MAG TPA: hypothetical protein VL200_03980 [Lacunisphaera sp.]|jgi:hypothetical protein|nr:hypothetical protein [Lacunisphaera sp.]